MTCTKKWSWQLKLAMLLFFSSALTAFNNVAIAQIIPDTTLGAEGSRVIPSNVRDLIEGGAIRDTTLFHSFREFNVSDGQQVYFVNPSGIANILTRVTGNNISRIFGTLGVNGNANLFLINPNGIIFGANSRLDVAGSFAATTANSVIFDNYEFSATNPTAPPLLKISVTPGLQYGVNDPTRRISNEGILSVGQDFSLIGGHLNLGGQLWARNGGSINLIAIGDITTANMNTTNQNGNSGNINLVSRNGSIFVNGGRLTSSTNGSGNTGEITLQAAQNVEITDSDLESSTSTTGGGDGNNITITAGNSVFLTRSWLLSEVYEETVSNAGDITVTAGNSIFSNDSQMNSSTSYRAIGNAGNVTVTAPNKVAFTSGELFAYPGILAFARGLGNAGNVNIQAGSLEMVGALIETGISYYGRGTAGNVNINVRDAMVMDASRINAYIKPSGTNAVGLGEGNIDISAGSVSMIGSHISNTVGDRFIRGTGRGNAGNISVQVQNDLSMNRSFIASQVLNNGTGNAGRIDIQAGSMNRIYQSVIASGTAGVGNGNTVSMKVDGDIFLVDSSISTVVEPRAIGNGYANETDPTAIRIQARSLSVTDGAQINTVTSGRGNAGNIVINAAQKVRISDTNTTAPPEPNDIPNNLFFPDPISPLFVDGVSSGIFTSTTDGGRGGNITLYTGTMSVSDGAVVDARTTGSGSGGTIKVNANNLTFTQGGQLSAITTGSGNGGTININANQVQISGSDATYEARLAQFGTQTDIYGKTKVGNQGAASGIFVNATTNSTGDAGNININTTNLNLSDRALLSASTTSGEGGNINLNVSNLLLMRYNSLISAQAESNGNGGNIDINAQFVVAVPSENSDITANAFQGRGGNINLMTQGIYGLQVTDVTPRSDISASSRLGIDGTINLDIENLDPARGLTQLPSAVSDPTDQIVAGCASDRGASFVVTGRGGLPEDPTKVLRGQIVLQDLRSTPSQIEIEGTISQSQFIAKNQQLAPIVEATGWVINANGQVELVTKTPHSRSSWNNEIAACGNLQQDGKM